MTSKGDPAAVCPVDHKAREAWLQQARANGNAAPNPHTSTSASTPASPLQSQPTPQAATQTSCDSTALLHPQATPAVPPTIRLSTSREISSIPRALPSHDASSTPTPASTHPANNETETAPDAKTGNWIYPSEHQFFAALTRKSLSASPTDMSTIVPLHNAVNERAWAEILAWERGRGGEKCGGPKLASFSGLATRWTPRAWWNVWVGGRMAPFDRHDWVVERCGRRVDYVIDFYAGKADVGGKSAEGGRGMAPKPVSFYLDVRPKLNTWEGWKMRFERYWGLG